MKTFDIALKHLQQSGIDFKLVDIYLASEPSDTLLNQLDDITLNFMVDPLNDRSNDHYKGTVFMAALFHLAFEAHNEPSFFDKASEIINSEIGILTTGYEHYRNTIYPKAMMDKWEEYCNSYPKIGILQGSNEISFKLFTSVYHYLVRE